MIAVRPKTAAWIANVKTLRPREIATAALGWSGYILGLTTYCIVHQLIVRTTPVDPLGSFIWAVREWGFWILLSPLIFLALRKLTSESRDRRILHYLPLLLLGTLLCSLSIRMLIAVNNGEISALSALIIHAPRHTAACLAVFAVWYFLLRHPEPPTPTGQTSPETTAQTENLLVYTGQDQTLLPIRHIESFSAARNYVDVSTGDKTYLLRSTMKQLEANLPNEHFVRCHRSHIVRVDRVERIKMKDSGNGLVVLKSGVVLPLSRGYRERVRNGSRVC